ncbi:uncharacterized protein LOC141685339 [Apium graveolens]|uniref:uncharacterized protein LOC141685339 n=1 Tax=Apium graveolens TaxID=4045 RepID=UPI003D7C01D0
MNLDGEQLELCNEAPLCAFGGHPIQFEVPKQPPEEKTSVLSPIPFVMWAIDIDGILPTSTRQVRAHPHGNGAIEVANKIIFQGIKKRLGDAEGRWAKELPWVLWAYRTTPRSSTGETPFRLASGTDALVPVEVGLESYINKVYNVEINNFGLRANVDLLEEEREVAHKRNIKYLLQAAQYYDLGIKKRSFSIGDFVLRELAASIPTRQGKLQPNWEGPYKMIVIVLPGTYMMEILAGEAIKNTWHASRLRKFYQ